MLREEIEAQYIDGNGLVTPNPVSKDVIQGSDNGPMYTSEYYAMLYKNKQYCMADLTEFLGVIIPCTYTGLLNRIPRYSNPPSTQTGPDDYYGVLSACKCLGITSIPLRFLSAVWRYKGALNNVNPGQWTLRSFLVRQPQLLAAMLSAAYPRMDSVRDWVVRILAFPFFVAAAVVIATSCIGESKDSTDPRRLSWHLIQATAPVSLLCRIASILWYKRLYSVYPNGMKDVAAIYYHGDGVQSHPFARYWKD